MPVGGTERLAVPSTPSGLVEAARAFDAFSAAHRLPDAIRQRVLLALDEVLSNVVRHGQVAPAAPIYLSFAWNPGRLVVEIRDTASPFNPLDLPAPDTTLSLDARVPGGLGVALVRALVDEVAYARQDQHNILTLTLHVPPDVTGDVNGHS